MLREPSTAVMPTKRPATVLSRKRTSGVGPSRPEPGERLVDGGVQSAERSLVGSPGMPNQTARTERAEVGIFSIARAVARSVAIVTPARTPASTAVATDEPERRDEGPAVPAPESPPREPGDDTHADLMPGLRRRRYAAVFVRFPQIDIEHHFDDALRDAS